MLTVYNTLTRKKEPFRPAQKGWVNLFVCGPTVYDLSHIGHARTYVAFDMIVKYLRSQNYNVFYLQNITDIEDKIIDRAKRLEIDALKLSHLEEKEYYLDMKALGITSVSKYARATDYIEAIIKQVQTLIEKKHAYVANGSVYFDIATFSDYAKLSHQSLKRLKAAMRIEKDKNKKNEFDFVLWKAHKPGEPQWDSPWGPGRPGWHIEDTAITESHFGPQYDVHGGGMDLIFPHHESEIAQMEASSGKVPFVRYWLHTGFIKVRGQKMSKSLGNFITIRNFLSKHPVETLRFLVLSTHYRSPIDYNETAAKQADQALSRIYEFLDRIKNIRLVKPKKAFPPKKSPAKVFTIDVYRKKFAEFMDDDFNTPKAMALLFNLVKEGNRLLAVNALTRKDAKGVETFLHEINEIFGILTSGSKKKDETPDKILDLISLREKHRSQKDWKKADELRKMIEIEGYILEDTPEGPKVKKLN